MKYSQEFFTQRSFEVVWAVFRVGEFVSRKELRELLEQKALGYLSRKAVDNLDELDEVIKLSIQIGEIKDVNGRVLLRETGHLREALLEREQSVAVQKDLSERSIEEIFGGRRVLEEGDDAHGESGKGPAKEIHNPAIERPKNEESGKSDLSALPDSGLESGNGIGKHNTASVAYIPSGEGILHNPATQNAENNPAITEADPADPFYRKQAILELLKKRNMCGMRDLIAALPHVSERTLRYDVQSLIERNLVERIGKGGPQSFLRLRNHIA